MVLKMLKLFDADGVSVNAIQWVRAAAVAGGFNGLPQEGSALPVRTARPVPMSQAGEAARPTEGQPRYR